MNRYIKDKVKITTETLWQLAEKDIEPINEWRYIACEYKKGLCVKCDFRDIEHACKKVDNAVNAGAMAVGAKCTIKNERGYQPLLQNEHLSAVFENNALLFMSDENIYHGVDMTGLTDMGDLSKLCRLLSLL